MKTINKTKFAIGASIITGLTAGCSMTDSKPFAQKDLSSGYMNEAESAAKKAKDATCGEGKCGEKKCGAKKATPAENVKAAEGKCGEGKCGDNKAKPAEGKCGEGKCGASK